jgi:Methyltransferase domain
MASPTNPLEYIREKYKVEFIDDGKHSPTYIPQIDRKELATLFNELGYRVGAEIGVEQGMFSEVLLSRNLGLKLFCVDAWARYSKYRDHVSQEKLDGFYRATEDRLKPFNAILVRGYSAEVSIQFKRESLDFVYIDANHSLPYVIQDISLWSEKVRPGGIVAGHDYIKYRKEKIQCHVVEAVHAWTKAYRITPWFVIGPPSEHPNGIPVDNKKGMGRPGARSWMWVKEG